MHESKNREEYAGSISYEMGIELERVWKQQVVEYIDFSNENRIDRWKNAVVCLKDALLHHTTINSLPAIEQQKIKTAFQAILPYARFHAYPGAAIINSLLALIRNNQLAELHQQTESIFSALIGKKIYRDTTSVEEFEKQLHSEQLIAVRGEALKKPHFEIVVALNESIVDTVSFKKELYQQQSTNDRFSYEIIVVTNFQDVIYTLLNNPNVQSAVICEGVTATYNQMPIHKKLIESGLVPADLADKNDTEEVLILLDTIHKIRPEIDNFVITDRADEALFSDRRSYNIKRIFYGIEETRELHFSILKGIEKRYETPFFSVLKSYAQRPIGTFHALPVARGKSILKSNWIKDFGEFYGPNLFLAESSATTGGLDSLLEPKGSIKQAQDAAARAFGAEHCYFVTNGTSTSNKIIEIGLLKENDIVLIDRNCHKSHHYGIVQAGANPLYVEAYPMQNYSMYGGVPLKSLKEQLLLLKSESKLHQVKMVVLTNCTFDGHVFNPFKVMQECLAIKPDLYFLWDEAWFGFARFSPFFRQRTGMAAAKKLAALRHDPKYKQAYLNQRKRLGSDLDPNNPALLTEQLLCDPDEIRIRVYQTNSTHKSMSALRQGSMILVSDQDFEKVEETLHEAIFIYASTSPNMQLIASLDIARRQMELEGYELVMQATQLAFDIRHAVNHDPLIAKFFKILTLEEMVPLEYRASKLKAVSQLTSDNWPMVMRAMSEDEFMLDPTRITLVTGYAGFDGTKFKELLTDKYDIQLNKTSRNSVLLQININNTRSDVAHLVKVLSEISVDLEKRYPNGMSQEPAVLSLMKEVPEMPNFSHFHDHFRTHAKSKTVEGNIRKAFYMAYNPEDCEHIKLNDPVLDQRLKSGPELVSANFVIPYPPGFPILVPGQVITKEVITFMRKLDVKEIHGYNKTQGFKLLKHSSLNNGLLSDKKNTFKTK